jgi:hypothetical protein
MNQRTQQTVIRWTIPALAVWPVAVVGLTVAHHGTYDSVDQAISELARTRGGVLLDFGFVAMGLAMVAIAATLRLGRRGVVSRAALAIAGVLTVISGFAETNAPGESASTHSRIHEAAGIATFLLLIVVMYGLVLPFRRDARWSALSLPTLGWSVAATGGFFLIPILGDARFGLAQRTFVVIWLSWLFVVGNRIRTLGHENETAPARQAVTL